MKTATIGILTTAIGLGSGAAHLRAGQDARAAAPAPTFARDVAPILYKNCVGCHRPGEMGPMSLVSYTDARPWATSIRDRVVSRSMPPWSRRRSRTTCGSSPPKSVPAIARTCTTPS